MHTTWSKQLKAEIDGFLRRYPDWKHRLVEEMRLVAAGESTVEDSEMLAELRRLCELRGLRHDLLAELITYEGSSRKDTGQFFTPEPVARFMVEAMDVPGSIARKEFEDDFLKIAEPCCGTGTFVVAAYAACVDRWVNFRNALWFCMDVDPAAAACCAFNCYIRGINAIIFHGDAIKKEWHTCWAVLFANGPTLLFAIDRDGRWNNGVEIPILADLEKVEEYFDALCREAVCSGGNPDAEQNDPGLSP